MSFANAIEKCNDTNEVDDNFCPFHAAGWTAAESDARASIPQHGELWQDEAWIDGYIDCLKMKNDALR